MKTILNRSARWLAMLMLLGAMSTAMAQSRAEAAEKPSVEALQMELDELQAIDKSDLNKAERKSLRKEKRKLKRQIDRLYLAEWQHIQATNPYARNNRWDAYRYGYPYYRSFYHPYYYYPRRIYIIRR